MPVVFLQPGEYYISRKPEIIVTVLGSCVSVVLYSKESDVCGITHSQLPSCSYGSECCRRCDESYRYTDCSIIRLVQKMEESKIDIKTLGAKVFGGAGLIASNSAVKDKIGRRNIEVALGTLAKEGIKVISRDTGGSKGRKLFLNSKTKEVLIKKLQ